MLEVNFPVKLYTKSSLDFLILYDNSGCVCLVGFPSSVKVSEFHLEVVEKEGVHCPPFHTFCRHFLTFLLLAASVFLVTSSPTLSM